jgi:hypothetical protein
MIIRINEIIDKLKELNTGTELVIVTTKEKGYKIIEINKTANQIQIEVEAFVKSK